MAAGAFDDKGVPSPEREVIDHRPPNPHTDLYVVRKFADMERALDKISLTLDLLKERSEGQSAKLDKLADRSHEIDKNIVEINTKLMRVIDDYKDLDKKLDKVRTWVIGAAGIVTLLAFVLPAVIAKVPWPGSTAPPATEQNKNGRR